MSSTANRVVKNTGFLYAKMGITMFISLYTTRLILNSLGAADFGIFNIVGGAIAMLGFLNAAMAGATQRFMSYSEGEGNKKKQKSIFNISILLHFFIALAAGIALLIAGYFFFNGILNIPADRIFAAKVVYGSLIVSTMFTVMSVPYDAVLNAHENMKYYAYYLEAYTAVLGGMVGTYEIQEPAENGSLSWVAKYGLKAFSPIAKHFPYQDYDDFGVSRSYGFKRQHLGHDMMGQVGTPVIAVESGYVEAIGWNQYGGWRLGIRSFDKKRYYYYAHLRKNYPYHKALKEGSIVQAGDVIGYLGRTGYSRTENTNNIDEPHLHFGLQLIFDESQKDGNNEIWIDCYELVKFLALNRSETVKDQETKEYDRVYEMRESGT